MQNNTTIHQRDILLSRREAAQHLGVTEGTLAIWKCTKRYPLPYLKVGRKVKYRLSDLEAFLQLCENK